MHPVSDPLQRLPLQQAAGRGIYEVPWYATDRRSILLAAVDSDGCLVGWERVRRWEEYEPAMQVLRDLLNLIDPCAPVALPAVAPALA